MKIIEILNKIANGEEVPKVIKYCGFEYEYSKRLDNTFNYRNVTTNEYLNDEWFIESILNEEVEVIEEIEIGIETIENYELEELYDWKDVAYFYQYKFNELIEVIKDMKG